MKYVANPVIVDAFKITEILQKMSSSVLVLKLENGNEVVADSDMTARYTPVGGDYWVIQSDGYEYINPAHVFERKYSPLIIKE